MKPPSTIPPHTLRRWLAAIAEDTRAFQLADTTPAEPSPAPADLRAHAVDILPDGARRPLRLIVHPFRAILPQTVLATAPRLAAAGPRRPASHIHLLAAPFISPRVADLCREHGLGYFDAAGNCRLAAPGLHLSIQGRPNPAPAPRPADDPFAPKSSRVVRALLEQPHRWWQVQHLAAEMGISLGLASRIKSALVNQAFAETSRDGVRLRDPAALLEAWAAAWTNRARPVPVYSLDPIATLEQRAVQWGLRQGVPVALAEFSAAARLAPMVRYNRAAVYVAESPDRDVVAPLLADLDLKIVDTGATALLWITADESVFYRAQPLAGLLTVSPLQAYLDLRRNPARGPEAAAELLTSTLPPAFARENTR